MSMGKGVWGEEKQRNKWKKTRPISSKGKGRDTWVSGGQTCQGGTPDEHQSWEDARGAHRLTGSTQASVNQQIADLLLG